MQPECNTHTLQSLFSAIAIQDDDAAEAAVRDLSLEDEPELLQLAEKDSVDSQWWAIRALAACGGEISAARLMPFLAADHAELLIGATELVHNLTQILRLCLVGAFDPEAAPKGMKELLVRAGDAPTFAAEPLIACAVLAASLRSPSSSWRANCAASSSVERQNA